MELCCRFNAHLRWAISKTKNDSTNTIHHTSNHIQYTSIIDTKITKIHYYTSMSNKSIGETIVTMGLTQMGS